MKADLCAKLNFGFDGAMSGDSESKEKGDLAMFGLGSILRTFGEAFNSWFGSATSDFIANLIDGVLG